MTAATLGNWSFVLGTSASPQVLTALPEVLDISGLGSVKELIETTSFDSTSDKEYIAGLGDGVEFTVQQNYLPGNTAQEMQITAALAGNTRLFEARYTGVSPQKTVACSVVCLGTTFDPNHSSQNQIEFSYKITGALTYS